MALLPHASWSELPRNIHKVFLEQTSATKNATCYSHELQDWQDQGQVVVKTGFRWEWEGLVDTVGSQGVIMKVWSQRKDEYVHRFGDLFMHFFI